MSEEPKKEDKPSVVSRYNPLKERWETKKLLLDENGVPRKVWERDENGAVKVDEDGQLLFSWAREEEWTEYTDRKFKAFTMSNFIDCWLSIVASSKKENGEVATLSMLSKEFGKSIASIKRKKAQIDSKYKKAKGLPDTEENKTFSIFPPITERHTEEEKGWIAREKARSQRETLDSVLGDLSADQKKLLNLID